MAEVSESLKAEMSAALRGDLERARGKRTLEPAPEPEMETAPAPQPEPEPERRSGLFRRFRS